MRCGKKEYRSLADMIHQSNFMYKEHPSTPLPIWEDFDHFFADFNGLPAYLAIQLAQIGGEIGEYNLKRLEWWIKMWSVYVYYRSKYAKFRRAD